MGCESPHLHSKKLSTNSSTSSSPSLYSHTLYQNQPAKDITRYQVEESRWSSCSTSPSSSCESFDHFPLPPSSRLSATSSALSTALSTYSSAQSSRPSSYSSSRYADDHYPLITRVKAANLAPHTLIIDIAHSFNVYIRAINSCYNHAVAVEEEQLSDFLFFNQTLYNILSQHFELGRQHLRPLLHRPASSPYLAAKATILYDDATFQSAFDSWARYIHDKATTSTFSGVQYRSFLSAFAPQLVQHLHNEVEQLNALVINKIFMPEHLCKIWSHFVESLSSKLDLHTDAALLLGCHDKDFKINDKRSEHNFPRLSMGTTTMIKKWHSRRHHGAWTYCSSDFSGKRRLIDM